jgi:DNA/RNA-binding domain of Phe-tRNA-synthetase-like protein
MSAEVEAGWIAPEIREEFPELRLWSLRVEARAGRSNPGLKERLALLSSRYHGAKAIQLRTDPIPHAYRVFYRHIGIDPDADRIPLEAAVLDRLLHGGFRSYGLVDDALVIALVETGVPVWAFDDDTVEGPLGIRLTGEREDLGRGAGGFDPPPVREGRIVVADAESPLAELFGEPAPGHGVGPGTSAIRLFTVQPAGVPAIHVEEALWTCAECLDTPAQ